MKNIYDTTDYRTITAYQYLTYDDLGEELWSDAKENWDYATETQRRAVWEAILLKFRNEESVKLMRINDFVRYECNHIFFEEEESEDWDISDIERSLSPRGELLWKLADDKLKTETLEAFIGNLVSKAGGYVSDETISHFVESYLEAFLTRNQ